MQGTLTGGKGVLDAIQTGGEIQVIKVVEVVRI
jgi:hypothetical protein